MMTPDEPLLRCVSQVITSPHSTRPPVISLPGANDPRVFIPVDRRMSAVRALAQRSDGRSLTRRVGKAALSGAILSGVSSRLPSLRTVLSDEGSDEFQNWMSDIIDVPHRVSLVFVGPRRANRKPVVFVTSFDDELVAVVKLGYNDVTRPLVRYEASVLAKVASRLENHAYVPSLIGAARVGDLEAMAMRPLPPIDERRQVDQRELSALVRAIGASGAGSRRQLSTELGHPRMRPLASIVSAIDEALAHAPVGAIHGDFHSGNIGVAARDGCPVVWDWERWTDGIPLGFDLLHHKLQFWITRDGVEPQTAAHRLIVSASDLLAPLDVNSDIAPDVARDYLIRLAARYIGDAQDQAGARLGAVEKWLFPAVLGAPGD